MKRINAFDGLSADEAFSDRYERIRNKSTFIGKKWKELVNCRQDLQKASILVIGPGTGKSDLEPIKTHFPSSNIIVIDFKKGECPCVDSWLRHYIKKEITESQGKITYDIVVAQQILQHTTDWRSFLYVLNKILADNGIFVFDSFDASIFQAIQGQPFSVNTDCIQDEWEKFFLSEYRKREFQEGIFWDPEFVSNRPPRLGTLLELLGFSPINIGQEEISPLIINADDLKQSFINREYGPLFWGSKLNQEPLSENGIPHNGWQGKARYQLHAYSKNSVPNNFPDLLNNVRMINNRAVLRLDTHLRYDVTVKSDDENLPERMFLSYIQSLLFASAVDCSTDLFFPYLGDVKNTNPLDIYYSTKQHALISRNNYSKAISIFSHHYSLMKLSMSGLSFTDFLGKKVGIPTTLVFHLEEDNNEPYVRIFDCDFGLLMEFFLPEKWRIEVPIEEKIFSGTERVFSHYLYTDLKKYLEDVQTDIDITSDMHKISLIKSALVKAIQTFNFYDFSIMPLQDFANDLAKYVYASRALWSNYKVIFYIIHQLYADRNEPDLQRNSEGIGSVIILENPKSAPLTYLDKDRLALLHVITREFASSKLFYSMGEIEKKHAQKNAELNATEKLYKELIYPTKSLLDLLDNANKQVRTIRARIEPTGQLLFEIKLQNYFNNDQIEHYATMPIKTHHDWKDDQEHRDVMGAVVLTAVGIKEETIGVEDKKDLWSCAQRLLMSSDQPETGLRPALSILLAGTNDEHKFNRLKMCFNTIFQQKKKNFSTAILIALFPKYTSDKNTILKYIDKSDYKLKYSGDFSHDKFRAIWNLIYEDDQNPDKIEIDFKPPQGGSSRTLGYVQIKATGSYERINVFNIYNSVSGQNPSNDALSSWASPIFSYFGRDNMSKLSYDINSDSLFMDSDPEEKIEIKQNVRIIKFLISG